MVSCKSKGRKSNKGGREYRYLICSTRRRQGDSGCDNSLWIPYINFRDTILAEVSDKLKKLINVDFITEEYKEKIVRSKAVDNKKEFKKLGNSIDANRKFLFELRKMKMLGDIDDGQYRFEKEQYEKEIETLQTKLANASEVINEKVNMEKMYDEIRRALHDLAELHYEQLDEMRLVLFKLVEKLVVSKSGDVEVYTPLGQLEA